MNRTHRPDPDPLPDDGRVQRAAFPFTQPATTRKQNAASLAQRVTAATPPPAPPAPPAPVQGSDEGASGSAATTSAAPRPTPAANGAPASKRGAITVPLRPRPKAATDQPPPGLLDRLNAALDGTTDTPEMRF